MSRAVAATELNQATFTLEPSPLPGDVKHRSHRSTVLAAAAVLAVTVGVAASLVLRGGPGSHSGRPVFHPERLSGGQRVSTTFQTGVSYELPSPYQVIQDRRDETLVRFVGHVPSMPGFLSVQSLPWHAAARTVDDVVDASDDRVRVRQRRHTTVAGAPATRLVIAVPPHTPDLHWFCTEASTTSCIAPASFGSSTIYLFEHDGSIVALVATGYSGRSSVAMGRVADDVAATWRWAGH